MSITLQLQVIDMGRIVREPVITDDNWDGALFDFEEAKGRLEPGQWINIPDYWEIPEPHRIRFC